ncbi:gamma-glutamylcyclotransferase [Alkalihalobacillus sp. MEB130]|uniref:gamma-glutamylcyclotransferase family protein n=1 Tax=Alkalihalobacillus sp. MEB130 TaxID=2976704 RepID=UPI0028DE04F5|nr:gamma-glutamylcyclotransferase family protein [Alkalihalobacillus sp. MEB130]MDT8860654.1 gamma-glutamylcyclotransferase [Alkalihalobacillus sp. MEB130]
MDKKKHRVFVYGTLRKGGANDHYLNGATCICERCWVYGALHDTSFGYPVLKETEQRRIIGELYEVSNEQLAQLDVLEDFIATRESNEYERVVRTVFTEKSESEAFFYIAGKRLEQVDRLIKENDWLAYLK